MKKRFGSVLDSVKQAMFRPLNFAAVSIMGVFTALWGVWVANPFWSVFNTAEMFSYMQSLAPEWVWGVVAMFVGVTMIWGVVKASYVSLRNGAQAGFYYWLFSSMMWFLGDWHNTGGLTLLMIALYCGYIVLNLRINKSYFKHEKK